MDATRVREYAAADEPDVLALLHAAFGTWPQGAVIADAARFFRWKHQEGPLGPSLRLVAESDGELVGFCAWMPWRLRSHGHTYPAANVVDLAVADSHRRRGVYAELIRTARAHHYDNIACTLSRPNDNSRSGSVRGGTTLLTHLPVLASMPAPVRTALRQMRGARSGATGVGAGAVGAPRAVDVLRDTEGVEALLAIAQHESEDRLSTVKDLEYLTWRYGCAEPAYHAVAQRDPAGGLGLAIFRIHQRRRLRAATVCEMLIAPGELTLGRRLLREVARMSQADVLTCHFAVRSTQRRAAVRAGFLRTGHQLRPTVRKVSPDISPEPGRSDAWALCLGDFDML